MRTLKRALDPHDIMNPGKTVPMSAVGSQPSAVRENDGA
jgi:FAD linked oxidases, C-terminal domain